MLAAIIAVYNYACSFKINKITLAITSSISQLLLAYKA
jgi:hypothetical protein